MDEPRLYRKLPVDMLCLQWTGQNWDAVARFVRENGGQGKLPFDLKVRQMDDMLDLWIEKSKTWRYGMPVGDWIILERDGEGFYPCTRAEFEAGYEVVD
jgi:hypothetical protein